MKKLHLLLTSFILITLAIVAPKLIEAQTSIPSFCSPIPVESGIHGGYHLAGRYNNRTRSFVGQSCQSFGQGTCGGTQNNRTGSCPSGTIPLTVEGNQISATMTQMTFCVQTN